MKKIIYLLLAALMVTGIAAAQTRKKSKTKKKTTSAAVLPVTKGETKEYGNYLTTQVFTVKKGNNDVKIEYPVSGNSALVNSIRKYIKNAVNRNFTGSLETPNALITSLVKKYSGRSEDYIAVEIGVIYSNPNIVTFSNNGYEYAGGAHGMSWFDGATFLTANGEELNINMMPSFSKLRPYILEGMAKYYKRSVSDLRDILYNVDELKEYPQTVYIDKDGLTFIYQPYEIAPYMAGAPTSVIPLTSEIINMLPDKAQQFVKE